MSNEKPELTDAQFDELVKGMGGNAHAVETAWPESQNWELSPQLQGAVVEVEECTVNDRHTRRMTVNTAGGPVSLWESASLGKLFNTVKLGDVILVVYTGNKSLPGGREQRQFRVAVKPARS